MKIKKSHYDYMKAQINKLDREAIKKHKDLGLGIDKNKRFRWDLFRAAGLSNFASDELYNYLNDTHIDSALKSIVKELGV